MFGCIENYQIDGVICKTIVLRFEGLNMISRITFSIEICVCVCGYYLFHHLNTSKDENIVITELPFVNSSVMFRKVL